MGRMPPIGSWWRAKLSGTVYELVDTDLFWDCVDLREPSSRKAYAVRMDAFYEEYVPTVKPEEFRFRFRRGGSFPVIRMWEMP